MEDIERDLQDGEDIDNGKIRVEGVDDLKVQMFGRVRRENAVRPPGRNGDREREIDLPNPSGTRWHALYYVKVS